MSRTSSTFISFETLKARGSSAITIIKLMMTCNDLLLADQALAEWKKEQPLNKKPRQTGAGMYFVRTQLSHLHEGLKVLENIHKDSFLMSLVKQCDPETQESFHNLEQFLVGGSSRSEIEKIIGRIRHNLTFHYDESGKLIEEAISDRAARSEARISSITRGDHAHLWHFKVADDIVDSIVVRQIWKIPRGTDLRVEADKIADRVHQICLWFLDFSGELIWRYCK